MAVATYVPMPGNWFDSKTTMGYMQADANLSADNFQITLRAATETRNGRIPLGPVFQTPTGGASGLAWPGGRMVTLQFPELSNPTGCEVEVTYRTSYRVGWGGHSGGPLYLSAFASGAIFAGSQDSGLAEGGTSSAPTEITPAGIHFYGPYGNSGAKRLRIRVPLQIHPSGVVIASYEVSARAQAGLGVLANQPTLSTAASSLASLEMKFESARCICAGQQINTRIFSLRGRELDWPTNECWSTNVWSLTNCPGFIELSNSIPLTAAEIFAEPADTNTFVGERVDLGFSPALLMALPGDAPVEMQWFRSGNPSQLLPGETNAVLSLLSPALADSGSSYYVMLTNDSGSVTSRVATLTVTLRPPDLWIELTGGQRLLKVGGDLGSTYRIEHAENLGSTNWNPLVEFALDASPFTYEDTNAPSPGRFYRAVRLP